MTDTAAPDAAQDTETVEGILKLLRGRLARGESPHQGGDSFPFAAFLEAMYILHEESLDQALLAECVLKLKSVLALDPSATLKGYPQAYIDIAFRIVNRELTQAEEAGTTS